MNLLANPNLAVAGFRAIRNCHVAGAAVVLEPSLSSISQFSLDFTEPLAADVPVTITYRLTGNTQGNGIRAVVYGAGTDSQTGDDTYSQTITPTAETTSLQFRTGVNMDGTIDQFDVELAA